jgi:hypothetical protein
MRPSDGILLMVDPQWYARLADGSDVPAISTEGAADAETRSTTTAAHRQRMGRKRSIVRFLARVV